MNTNYIYYSFLIISILSTFVLFYFEDIKNKIKILYFIICPLLFGISGLLIKTILIFNYIHDNIYTFIFCIIFTTLISKMLVKNISESIILSNNIKVRKSFEYVGLTGRCETKITKIGGVVLLLNNQRISAITYDKMINKNDRILVTDYNKDDEVYVVDYYPI